MRILCLDIPAPGASLEKYAPHLNAEAMNVMAEFPLAKAGLLSFECIPLGSFINWENLFADEFKNKE